MPAKEVSLPERNSVVWRLTFPLGIFLLIFLGVIGTSLWMMWRGINENLLAIPRDVSRQTSQDLELRINAALNEARFAARSMKEGFEFNEAINDKLQHTPVLLAVQAYDLKGERVIVSYQKAIMDETISSGEGDSIANSKLFLNALAGEEYLGESQAIGNAGVIVEWGLPIVNTKEEIVGVLKAQLDVSQLWEVVSSVREGEVYILDSQQRVVLASQIEEMGRDLSVYPLINDIKTNLGQVSEGVGKSGEERVLAVAQPIWGGKWVVVLEVSKREIYLQLKILFGIFGCLSVLGIGAFMWQLVVLNRQVLKPLKTIRESIDRFAEGELNTRIEMKTGSEFVALLGGFNQMAQKLQEIYVHLEEKVKEKTGELVRQNSQLEEGKVAMVNLLEDAKNLEEQLKQEKEGVEKQVIERTRELSQERAELLAVINSISRGLLVVDKGWQAILQNKEMGEIMQVNGKVDYLTVAAFLKPVLDLDKMVAEVFGQKKEVRAEPKLMGARYIDVHTVPVMHETVVGAVAIFIKDVTEETAVQRSRDEFFSIASHELRTPLTAIRGNTEMILDNYKDKITDKEVLEMLTDVHEGSVRLIEIVNDFLNVSRLEMGKMEFKQEAIDLVEVASGVVKEFEVTGSRQKVEIIVEAPESLPKARGDSDRIKQVLINLIGNGLKFTKDGSIRIEFVPQKEMIQINVVDTGEGIPKELQGLLFHKFQQAGSSLYTRDTSKGTGLGLYISKLMVEGMGGKIWLEKSEVGKGSTFAICLPILAAQLASRDKGD